MRIAVVFGNDGSDARLGKTCRSLVKLGHDVHFIGWDRRPKTSKQPDLGGAHTYILRHATQYAHSTLLAQWRFTLHVFRQLARIRPHTVCAVNEDNAFRLLPFRNVFYRRLVCDVMDSHRDRGTSRALPVRLSLSAIAELARIGADTLVTTDTARFELFGRHQHKTKIIGNYPEDPGEHFWRRWPSGQVKLCVCGSLTESRGLRQLLSVADQTDELTIVAAGWPNDGFATRVFVRHPKVSYHGIVPLRKSLELASQCDAIFAFYAPISRNNILASPTKLYDAMSVGRPVIINSEAQISKWVVEKLLGVSCPYDDTERLHAIIRSLSDFRGQLRQFAQRSRGLFVDRYNWNKMEEVLVEIYGRDSAEQRADVVRDAA